MQRSDASPCAQLSASLSEQRNFRPNTAVFPDTRIAAVGGFGRRACGCVGVALVGWDGCEVRLCDPCIRVPVCARVSPVRVSRAPGSPGEDMYTQCLLATSKGTCMRCTVCVGTLPNLGYLRHLRHLRQKTVKPVFSVQVSARRLTVLTMLDHCGAQVAGARCNCTCLRHSLAPRARAPC